MRRRRRHHRDTKRITLNLASMIDVTFLLLIYFLVTTVLMPQEDALSPLLQTEREGAAGADDDFEPQILDVAQIDGAPGYRMGARIMRDRDELALVLDELPRGPGLFVRVEGDVPVGFAVTAIQLARDAGFEQVTYVPQD